MAGVSLLSENNDMGVVVFFSDGHFTSLSRQTLFIETIYRPRQIVCILFYIIFANNIDSKNKKNTMKGYEKN